MIQKCCLMILKCVFNDSELLFNGFEVLFSDLEYVFNDLSSSLINFVRSRDPVGEKTTEGRRPPL